MLPCSFALTAAILSAGLPSGDVGRIEGIVVNGAGFVPLAGVEVVLRAGDEGGFAPVAQTVTDAQGRFRFDQLPVEPGLVYLPGANRHDVHYPGPRIRLRSGAETARTSLTVYDAISSPSPLEIEEQEIELEAQAGALQVTETLVVANRTKTAYVGEAVNMPAALTLRLAIPPGFERVTFFDEFHGRRFHVVNGHVATDIPWPPGQRTLKYTYRLPVAEDQVFARTLDLPCSQLRVTVRGDHAGEVVCNLPRAAAAEEHKIMFQSQGARLPSGHRVEVRFGDLPLPWMAYARWASLGLLAALMAGTAWFWRFRSRAGEAVVEEEKQSRPALKKRAA